MIGQTRGARWGINKSKDKNTQVEIKKYREYLFIYLFLLNKNLSVKPAVGTDESDRFFAGQQEMATTRRQREHAAQARLMAWTLEVRKRYPELNLLFAIPNGEYRDWKTARKLRAEGVKAGVPDLFLPVPRGGHHGLWIEMKMAGGRLSKAQRLWHRALEDQGYLVKTCWSAEEAQEALVDYLRSMDSGRK